MVNGEKIQKGLETILTERGLYAAKGLNKVCNPKCTVDNDACCCIKLMSVQPDFKSEVEWLEATVKKRGHNIIFFPKFHCELNPIEMVWAYVKAQLRKECKFKFDGLRERRIINKLDNVPISYIRKVQQYCFRFTDGYRKGLTGKHLQYAMKVVTGHRKFPDYNGELLKNVIIAKYNAKLEAEKPKTLSK